MEGIGGTTLSADGTVFGSEHIISYVPYPRLLIGRLLVERGQSRSQSITRRDNGNRKV
jgi:hypothetical protein